MLSFLIERVFGEVELVNVEGEIGVLELLVLGESSTL